MRRWISTFALGLTRTLETLAAVLVGVAVCINLAQVVSRRIMGSPLPWSEEAMRYTIIWVTFLAAAAAVYRGDHMAAGMLGRIKNRQFRIVLRHVVLLVVAGFSLVLAIWGARYAMDTGQISPALRISMNYAYASVAVGGALMVFLVFCILAGTREEPSDEPTSDGPKG